ncbi:MAG: hypothetical protein HQM03_03035 [Magnetococcales bacterium]|nr:hypothetical protein [Magnetococcales bacterium]
MRHAPPVVETPLPRAGGIGLLSTLPYLVKLALVSKSWRSEVIGGVLRGLREVGGPGRRRSTRRCPDGHKPHLSVCHRGWRGTICQECDTFRY